MAVWRPSAPQFTAVCALGLSGLVYRHAVFGAVHIFTFLCSTLRPVVNSSTSTTRTMI